MSTVTDMLNDLAEGRTSVKDTMVKFAQFDWLKPGIESPNDLEGKAPVENSFDEVQIDSRLTTRQYAQLANAYRHAVGGQDG